MSSAVKLASESGPLLLGLASTLQMRLQFAVYALGIFNRNTMRSLRDLYVTRTRNCMRERASAARREYDVLLRTQYQDGKFRKFCQPSPRIEPLESRQLLHHPRWRHAKIVPEELS